MKLDHKRVPTPKRLRGCKSGRRPAVSSEQAEVIRLEYELEEWASYTTLARRHGVNPSTIRHIIQYMGAYANV